MLAIVAGGAAYLYLRDVQNRAYHNATLTTVYVVEGSIGRGTPAATAISGNLIKQASIPEQFRPEDAVTDLASLQGEVAVANLVPGEVVSSGLFVSPVATASGPSVDIPKGDVAVTVSVSTVQDVAGLVQPGDLVDILVLFQNKTERYLYQNAQVLAVGTTVAAAAAPPTQTVSATSTTTAPATSSGLITFVVPPDAAARLAFIESGGGGVASSLYLALVAPNNRPSQQSPVTSGDLIPASLSPK